MVRLAGMDTRGLCAPRKCWKTGAHSESFPQHHGALSRRHCRWHSELRPNGRPNTHSECPLLTIHPTTAQQHDALHNRNAPGRPTIKRLTNTRMERVPSESVPRKGGTWHREPEDPSRNGKARPLPVGHRAPDRV